VNGVIADTPSDTSARERCQPMQDSSNSIVWLQPTVLGLVAQRRLAAASLTWRTLRCDWVLRCCMPHVADEYHDSYRYEPVYTLGLHVVVSASVIPIASRVHSTFLWSDCPIASVHGQSPWRAESGPDDEPLFKALQGLVDALEQAPGLLDPGSGDASSLNLIATPSSPGSFPA